MDSKDATDQLMGVLLEDFDEACRFYAQTSSADNVFAEAPESTSNAFGGLCQPQYLHQPMNLGYSAPELQSSQGNLQSSSHSSLINLCSATQAEVTKLSKASRKRKYDKGFTPSKKPFKRQRKPDLEDKPKSTWTPHCCINSIGMSWEIWDDDKRRDARNAAIVKKIVLWAPRRVGGFLPLRGFQGHTRDISEYNIRPKAMNIRKNDPLRGFQQTQRYVSIYEADHLIAEWFMSSTDDMKSHFKAFCDHYATPEGKAKCLSFYQMGEEAIQRIKTQPPPILVPGPPVPQHPPRKVARIPTAACVNMFLPPSMGQEIAGETPEDFNRWEFVRNNPLVAYMWGCNRKRGQIPQDIEACLRGLRNWLHKQPLERRENFTSWATTFETTEQGSAQIGEFLEGIPPASLNAVFQSIGNANIDPELHESSSASLHQAFEQIDLATPTPVHAAAGYTEGSEQIGSGYTDHSLLATSPINNFEVHRQSELDTEASAFDGSYLDALLGSTDSETVLVNFDGFDFDLNF